MSSAGTRQIRFVCISDTHNTSPKSGAFKLPKGDILIHAGDLTKQGTYQELRKALEWISEAKFQQKIVIAGNHDISLDKVFYAKHGADKHNKQPEDVEQCIALFEEFPSIIYLNHELKEIIIPATETAPQVRFHVFGSPYSISKGSWAFGYTPDGAEDLWAAVPKDIDVLVTHTPPYGHCDQRDDRRSDGCPELLRTVERVKPALHVCGHIHDGRGAGAISRETVDKAQNNVDESSKLNVNDRTGEVERNSYRKKETVILNAAIMATSWPYQTRNGSLYNKPLVIDLDFPTE